MSENENSFRECYSDFIYVIRAALEMKEKWQSRSHPYLPGNLRSVYFHGTKLQLHYIFVHLLEQNTLHSLKRIIIQRLRHDHRRSREGRLLVSVGWERNIFERSRAQGTYTFNLHQYISYALFTLDVYELTSMSPSKFSIASIVKQMQMQRLGLNPFSASVFCIAIDEMLNFDGDTNANVRCE